MAIPGQQNINIGAENSQTGSDSLYTAFNKVEDNFSKLFSNASPYIIFNASTGISTTASSGNGVVTITNTGVTSVAAGTGITISSQTGDIIISASSNGNVGVTSVNITSDSLDVTGGPIVSSGTFTVELPTITISESFTPGEYIAPTLTVDQYGRINAIASTESVGTVTSVGLEVIGDGLSVANSPVTSNGIITITNTGVTRLNGGTGISLSGSTGEITISSLNLNEGTVTRIDFFSNTLTITGTPVTNTGNVTIDLPNNITVTGNITANMFIGNGSQLTGISASSSNTANTANTAATVTTNAQPNITSVGTLTSLTITGNITAGNASLGNLTTSNYFSGNGSRLTSITGANVTGYVPLATAANTAGTVTTAAQPNITSVGNLTNVTVSGTVSTSNANVSGNLVIGNTGTLLFNVFSNPSKQVALQAPDNLASGNLIGWLLPNTQGNVGEFLTNTGGNSELEWKTVATTAPGANNSTGQAGQIAFDSGYIYVCVATNTWKRASLTSWP
jgi:hypothetical protein